MVVFPKDGLDAADLHHVDSDSQNLHCYNLVMTIEHNPTTITYNQHHKSRLPIRTDA